MFMNDKQVAAKNLLDTRRKCTGPCGQLKYPNQFPQNGSKKNKHDTECKACKRERSRLYRASDDGRDAWLQAKYGITLEQYKDMLEKQHDVCACCGLPETTIGKDGETIALSVDHDHATKRVRGLLCRRCNTALGLFGDDFRRILEAAKYLQRVP